MQVLKGKKVRLRALEQSDIDTLYKWENNPAIWKVSNTICPYSRFALEQYLLSAGDVYSNRQLRLIIEDILTGPIPVGCIDLFDFDPHHQRAGIGILIDEAHQGNGFSSEALELLIQYTFHTLLLHQLYCNVGAANQKSISLFEKHGFVRCGIKKDWNRTGNKQFEDEWLFQLVHT